MKLSNVLEECDTIQLLDENGQEALYWVFGETDYEGEHYCLITRVDYDVDGNPISPYKMANPGEEPETRQLDIIKITDEDWFLVADADLIDKLAEIFIASGDIEPLVTGDVPEVKKDPKVVEFEEKLERAVNEKLNLKNN
jgi:uncharacterized protein YrzB (UPF0473 family)